MNYNSVYPTCNNTYCCISRCLLLIFISQTKILVPEKWVDVEKRFLEKIRCFYYYQYSFSGSISHSIFYVCYSSSPSFIHFDLRQIRVIDVELFFLYVHFREFAQFTISNTDGNYSPRNVQTIREWRRMHIHYWTICGHLFYSLSVLSTFFIFAPYNSSPFFCSVDHFVQKFTIQSFNHFSIHFTFQCKFPH